MSLGLCGILSSYRICCGRDFAANPLLLVAVRRIFQLNSVAEIGEIRWAGLDNNRFFGLSSYFAGAGNGERKKVSASQPDCRPSMVVTSFFTKAHREQRREPAGRVLAAEVLAACDWGKRIHTPPARTSSICQSMVNNFTGINGTSTSSIYRNNSNNNKIIIIIKKDGIK
jgi:hypothetical protein